MTALSLWMQEYNHSTTAMVSLFLFCIWSEMQNLFFKEKITINYQREKNWYAQFCISIQGHKNPEVYFFTISVSNDLRGHIRSR